MGGTPWYCICPFQSSAAETFRVHKDEVAESCSPDWGGLIQFLDEPVRDDDEGAKYCSLQPVSSDTLNELFDTEKPSEALVLNSDRLWESLDRGMGCYVICYDADGLYESVCFMGYSFD